MTPGDLLRWYGDDVFMYLGQFLWSDACVAMGLGTSKPSDTANEVALYFHHTRGIMWSDVGSITRYQLLSGVD